MPELIARFTVLVLLGAIAAGCGSSSSDGGSRYSISQDRAPARGIDPDSIPEVIPGPVIRTGTGNRSPYTVLGRTYTVLPTEEGYSERG
ncbi:MAG: septal ring lytic transglycosylase RlpA, partial [Gammaproteobacteria bacterium]|nr:septal ring lytic transglycosylase RlpA [Gammaproteobacteria bacterium]